MNQTMEGAVEAIENGQVEKGLNILDQLEETADHQQLFDIASLYQQLGRADKAKPIITNLLSYYPDEDELFVFAAELEIDLDQEEEAIEWLLEIKEGSNTYLQAQILLADLYQLQGLDEVAEQKLKRALEHSPDEPVLLAGLGDFHLERGDFNKSIPYLKQAEQKGFQFPDGSLDLRLAEAYSATGQFEEALKYYERGLDEKTELSAIFGYGYTALQVGDYQLAAKQFEELKRRDYEYVTLYPYLARAYEGQEMFKEALGACEQGLQVDEYNDALYAEAGKIRLKLGYFPEGEDALRQALAINPGNFAASVALLSYLQDEERAEEVLEFLSYLEDMGEQAPLFDWKRAKANWLLEDFEASYKHFQSVAEEFSEDSEFLEDYGRFLIEYGFTEKGITHLQKALTLNPSDHDLSMFVEQLTAE
ncbi:tetratricopeptide repeat protein [Salsuginibacillus kocurii]|uniref:tetratricopeptide repeat protein n=1 Tax=Salsuginibacillus kocurii TaxID=427078 RepID=UPI000380C926|nr:tetratricopeptide repeat protein [Salsuginibacillus kocurii]